LVGKGVLDVCSLVPVFSRARWLARCPRMALMSLLM
jgi:hypothetical protein